MGDGVAVLRDEIEAYSDGTVARVRVLSVPVSERFPDGVKYAFHDGVAGAEDPIVRFDNHHGPNELHLDDSTFDLHGIGRRDCYRAWRAALPSAKRTDW